MYTYIADSERYLKTSQDWNFGFLLSEENNLKETFSPSTIWPYYIRGCVINRVFCKAGFGPAPKISYLAVICQRLIWRGLDGNQSKVQPAKIARIARIAAGGKSEKARSQVSKLGVTCPLFALLPDRNIPLWTEDQTPMTTTMNIIKTTSHPYLTFGVLQIAPIHKNSK